MSSLGLRLIRKISGALAIVLVMGMAQVGAEDVLPPGQGRIVSHRLYLLYLPSSLENAPGRRPLVIGLSPAGSTEEVFYVWKRVAEARAWPVMASKLFRNSIEAEPIFADLMAEVPKLAEEYPIDRSRIIASGFSGGGMGAHMMAFLYPQVVAAIANCGVIHPNYLSGSHGAYPKRKTAVLIASKTDTRTYPTMGQNRSFLEDRNWRLEWTEFDGGHSPAPIESYLKATEWLQAQL